VIVMKFGGTSLADADRIAGAVAIVRGRRGRAPVVVVSALAGVTDLLVQAVAAAREGAQDRLEPILAELVRRHRWAISGSVASASRRHGLDLQVDAILEDLRQILRSVRVLGEGTPRAEDAAYAFGEILSSRIVAAALEDQGLDARWVDARDVLLTDDTHGAAEPDLEATAARAEERIAVPVARGEIPVMGGYYGMAPDGRTTTLGRGGGDTSAAVLGCVLAAQEIEIWTDVDGIMTADPRRVPAARTRETVSFAEAAELAFYGAKVLHPAAIAPAVRRRIPVRVLNALRPGGGGTRIVAEPDPGSPALASVACRAGITSVRVSSRTLRVDPEFLPAILADLSHLRLAPDLAVACETGAAFAVPTAGRPPDLGARLAGRGEVDLEDGYAIVCVVGHGLSRGGGAVRGRVLSALATHEPDLLALGGSAASVAALIPESRLDGVVRALHRDFFEGQAA
jgi:aspartate kinase